MVTARQAIEYLYRGSCDIFVRVYETDEITHISSSEEKKIVTGQPCRISYKSIPATSGDNVSSITQSVKLFLAPEIKVPEGSKIVVTQCGGTTEYKSSGKPALYPTHQEIELSLFDKWA